MRTTCTACARCSGGGCPWTRASRRPGQALGPCGRVGRGAMHPWLEGSRDTQHRTQAGSLWDSLQESSYGAMTRCTNCGGENVHVCHCGSRNQHNSVPILVILMEAGLIFFADKLSIVSSLLYTHIHIHAYIYTFDLVLRKT